MHNSSFWKPFQSFLAVNLVKFSYAILLLNFFFVITIWTNNLLATLDLLFN